MTVRRRRAFAVLGSAVAPALIWLVTVRALGHHLLVAREDGGPPLDVGLVVVVLLALLAALAGWGLLAALERLAPRRAPVVWLAVALLVLVLSFALLTAPGTPMSTKVPLGLMHLAVGAVLMPVLFGSSRQRSNAASSWRSASSR
jgi:hypothetical protein